MRRGGIVVALGLLLSPLATTSAPGSLAPLSPAEQAAQWTTLERTIVAGEDPELLAYAPGQPRVTRTLGWDSVGSGPLRRLGGFKHLSDIHVVDEESPARVEFLDECSTPFSAAYRPHEAMSLQVGNQMLRQLARIENGPATGIPLKFAISTGDNIDNNQLNEQQWFIRLLDGREVNPNSGDETYDGYTREQFAGAPSDEVLELAQEPFGSVGTKIPWYGVLGNHDGLMQGNSPSNASFEAIATGGLKPFTPLDGFEDCPDDPEDGDAIEDALMNALNTDARAVPADPDRHTLTHEELVETFFESPTKPKGHGLARAPQDSMHGSRGGYYGFKAGQRIRGISLDTISYDGVANGHIPDPQFLWLEEQLKRWSKKYYEDDTLTPNPDAKNRLIMIFSHHSSPTLNNPGANPAGAPYHCFTETDQPECADGEGLKTLLQRFPNVIAWVNGHEHGNAIRPFEAPADTDPARGFWEINTAAHIDWPQQSRIIEVGWKTGETAEDPDTVFIYTTTLDHRAPLKPNEDTQSPRDFLTSFSRVESFIDACQRTGQANCAAAGTEEDQNTKLTQKAPFNLTWVRRGR